MRIHPKYACLAFCLLLILCWYASFSSISSNTVQVDDAQQTTQNTDKDASLSKLDATIEKGCPRSKLVHTTYKPFPRYEKSWSRFSLWPSTRRLAQAWSVLYDAPSARPWNWFYSQPNCALYNKNIDLNYITCLNVFEAIQPEKDDLVTLLTQLTFGRFERVQQMASKWRGPMSVAFYVTSSELQTNVSQIEQWIHETGRRNIAVHFMVQRGTYFPINKLRNLALENARTEFVLQIDVDFMPSETLEFDINLEIKNGILAGSSKRALVVIAFEALHEWTLPQNKTQAIRLLDEQRIQLFHYMNYTHGHGPSDVDRWVTTDTAYQIFFEAGFEPYMVLNRSQAPRYPVQFLERHRNKMSQMILLQSKGFEFYVLPKSFLVHVPHEDIAAHSVDTKSCVEAHYRLFCDSHNINCVEGLGPLTPGGGAGGGGGGGGGSWTNHARAMTTERDNVKKPARSFKQSIDDMFAITGVHSNRN